MGQEESSLSPNMAAENKLLKDKINLLESEAQNYESLLSKADEHFEQQLNKMRDQVQIPQKSKHQKHDSSGAIRIWPLLISRDFVFQNASHSL